MPLLPTGSNLSIVTERVWEREITVRIDGTIIVLVYSDRENHILSPILVCRVRNVDVRASPRTSRFSYNLLQISQVYICLMVIDWCVIDGSLINISSREIREEIFGKSVCQYYKILTPESPPHCQLALQWWISPIYMYVCMYMYVYVLLILILYYYPLLFNILISFEWLRRGGGEQHNLQKPFWQIHLLLFSFSLLSLYNKNLVGI